jgi:hypothetical protein
LDGGGVTEGGWLFEFASLGTLGAAVEDLSSTLPADNPDKALFTERN